MVRSGLALYKNVLRFIQDVLNRRTEKTFGSQMIYDAFRITEGTKDHQKIQDDIMTMVRMGYLIPIQAGLGVMDRLYQIGEEGLVLICEKNGEAEQNG